MDDQLDQTSQPPSIDNPVVGEMGVTTYRDPLNFSTPDDKFLEAAKALIHDAKTFWEKKADLSSRRQQNEKYLFGRQLADQKLKAYNARYIDNVIYESEAYIKPIALSRMPDIVVRPGSDNPNSQQTAENLSRMVTDDIHSRARRRVLSLAFKHLPVYFIGAIKYFWNPEKGKDGDYDFKVVHPDNLILDPYAASNDPNDMSFIAEAVEYTVKEWVMRFPDKEQELYQELRNSGIFTDKVDEKTEAGMASRVKGWELWFTWYEKDGGERYERIEGVAWIYENLLLKKMKNPNWDWEGEKRTFTYKVDEAGNRTEQSLSEDQGRQLAMGLQIPGLQTDTVFHNHFENPEKPYIFLGYDQWGKTPIDETSRIEQVIYLQQNLDKRGKQITEMLDRSRGKHVFSTDGGLKKEDLEELDMADPDVDLLVDGPVTDVHAFIQGEQPSAQVINDKTDLRERIFDKMGVHGPARGEIDGQAPATNNQISREGDFTRADDLTDETINYAAEKMANAILQLIKLRYTQDHFVRILGDDGSATFTKINRDLVDDGMEVSISASGVDKLKGEQRAMDMAKMKLIDPYTFYKDTNMSDPKGRTDRLMLFLTNPAAYQAKYGLGLESTDAMAQALNGGQPQGGGSPQAQQDIAQLMQGQVPPVPSVVDPAYLQTLEQWLASPDFQQLIQQQPQLKDPILKWAEQAAAVAQGQPQMGAQPPAQPPQPGGGAPAGPVAAQNPQPGNTQRVAINPPQRQTSALGGS